METSCDTNTATTSIKKSPWGKISSPQAANLSDIISEEVARDLQEKELKKTGISDLKVDETNAPSNDIDTDISLLTDEGTENFVSDLKIAKILQQQFDKEYDDVLKRNEQKINGPAKVCLSFDNYRRAPLNDDFESDSEEELEDPRDRTNWDRFDSIEREMHTMPACGYKVDPSGGVVTKHDINLNGRMNACKLMSLPPEFHAGDGAEFDLKISNKVYNSLRNHAKNEQARRHRMRDKREDYASAEFAIDEYTRIILFKLINNRVLKEVNGVISVGKEAVVLHAVTDPEYENGPPLPQEVAIKVYKTTLSEYKQRDRYIRDDHRFKDRYCKQNTRGMVHLWAEKEMRNLRRLERVKIPAPKALTLKKHVLIMSFIGAHFRPAPKLKCAALDHADWVIAYEQTVSYMKQMYTEANLIHADLSEYNLLWFDNTVYIIDVSQSVEPSHDHAFWFLYRDCQNISEFFNRKRVDDVLSPDELFLDITGCSYQNRVALSELQQDFKLKPHMVDIPGKQAEDKFETAWERTSVARDLDVDLAIMDGGDVDTRRVADLGVCAVASCSQEVENPIDSDSSFEVV